MSTTDTRRTPTQVRAAADAGSPATSARSLLLTVLGEFVFPREGRAWTGALVEALGALGVEPKSARQALARLGAEGLAEAERHGRRVQWSLTEAGSRLIAEGTERIYTFMRNPHSWDGRWLVLNVAIPESQRRLRHQLRTRLTWLGMGSPAPGLWIVPDADKAGAARDVLDELGLADRAFAWVGTADEQTDPARLLSAAWDLSDVAQRYEDFIDDFSRRTPDSDREAFVAQVELIQAWRGFPFADPEIPPELLPAGWPGERAAATFHERRERWHAAAQAEWERMAASAAATR